METSFSNIAGYENEKKSLKEICLLLQRFKELCGTIKRTFICNTSSGCIFCFSPSHPNKHG